MKKAVSFIIAAILAAAISGPLFAGCGDWQNPVDEGYVKGKIGDFSVYEGTSAYRKVETAEELLTAIKDAKYHYTNVWDEETKTYTQQPAEGYTQDNFEGTVHVIEIANDIDLGYFNLSDEAKASGVVKDYADKMSNLR